MTAQADPAADQGNLDRRAGIGADGLLRITRDASGPRRGSWTIATLTARWPRCAGIRVVARYLVDAGLAARES
jgi:hypothetical protein